MAIAPPREEVKKTCDECATRLETELGPIIATGPGDAWPPPGTRPAFADVSGPEDSCLKAGLRQVLQETKAVIEGRPIRRFAAMRVGLIAFNPAGAVRCAFNNDGQASIGSMGKLAILYAAFQLREDVRRVVRDATPPIRDVAALEVQVRRLAGLTDTRPKEGQHPDERHWLQWILGKDLKDKLKPIDHPLIDFDGYGTPGVDRCGLLSLDLNDIPAGTLGRMNTLNGQHDNNDGSVPNWELIAQHPFARRLWMTAGWSNNRAANMCAHDIGMDYIAALMKKSGLATSGGLGLWLRDPYAGPPAGHHTRFLHPGGPGDPPSHTSYAATGGPRALAAMMIAIQRGARLAAGPTWTGLISPDASREMEQVLRFLPDPYGASAHILKYAFGTPVTDAFMKGGLTPTNEPMVVLSDWVYFETGGRRIGMIILDSHRQRGVENEEPRLLAFTDRAWKKIKNCVRL